MGEESGRGIWERKLGEGGERNMEEERGRGISEEYEQMNLGENYGRNVHGYMNMYDIVWNRHGICRNPYGICMEYA